MLPGHERAPKRFSEGQQMEVMGTNVAMQLQSVAQSALINVRDWALSVVRTLPWPRLTASDPRCLL
jgi:hypothetical protein